MPSDRYIDAVARLLESSIKGEHAYIEVLREGGSDDGPVRQLTVLEPERCYETADPVWPVIYVDSHNVHRLLRWNQVRIL